MTHVSSSTALLDALRRVVGPGHAWAGSLADSIDGVQATAVVAPSSTAEAAALLRLAHERGLAITVRGGGTMLGVGAPPTRLDVMLDTGRLHRVLEHAAGDLVVRCEAGVSLAHLQEQVAVAGQRLALDPWPSHPGATLGGIVAANAAGPRRLRYGTMRDLLIGLTVVLADGTVAHAGGKVVKNVAGYDLSKLFTGSLGTLGLLTEVILRLHPLPPAQRLVAVELADATAAGAAIQATLHSTLVPDALELLWEGGRGTLAALFEGIAPGVAAQGEAAQALLAAYGSAYIVPTGDEAALWQRMGALPWGENATLFKIAAPRAALAGVLQAIDAAITASGLVDATRCAGHAASTVLYVALSARDTPQAATLLTALRATISGLGGSVVVVQAPPALKRTLDVWGPSDDALPLMRRVKERFDARGVLSPGRFIGGL